MEKLAIKSDEVSVKERIALALYVQSKFPELSIKQIFQVLEDPIFLVLLSETIKEIYDE